MLQNQRIQTARHVELSRMMSKPLDQLGTFRQRCCRIRSCDYLHSTAFPIFSYQRTIFYTLPTRYRISVFLRQPSTFSNVEGLQFPSNTCIALAFQGISAICRHPSMFTDNAHSSSDSFRLSPFHPSDAFDTFWDSSTLTVGTTPAYRVEYIVFKEHIVG